MGGVTMQKKSLTKKRQKPMRNKKIDNNHLICFNNRKQVNKKSTNKNLITLLPKLIIFKNNGFK